jgi:hypothetical protein
MNLLGNARYSPTLSNPLLRLETNQGGNLETLKMKIKSSTNDKTINGINGVNNYTKHNGKLE